MKFMTYRELRNTPSAVWKALEAEDAVAIVSNGTPRALLLDIVDGDLEGTLQLVRRIRAQQALSRLRADAARRGVDRLSDEEIDAEVAAARAERHSG